MTGLLNKGNLESLLKKTKTQANDNSIKTDVKTTSKIETLLRSASMADQSNASMNQSNVSGTQGEFISPFRQLQIIVSSLSMIDLKLIMNEPFNYCAAYSQDKLHHVMVRDKYALTEEDILRNEEINGISRRHEDDEPLKEMNR